jgi:hypothetical protein
MKTCDYEEELVHIWRSQSCVATPTSFPLCAFWVPFAHWISSLCMRYKRPFLDTLFHAHPDKTAHILSEN